LQSCKPLTGVTIGALIPVGVLSTEEKLIFSLKYKGATRNMALLIKTNSMTPTLQLPRMDPDRSIHKSISLPQFKAFPHTPEPLNGIVLQDLPTLQLPRMDPDQSIHKSIFLPQFKAFPRTPEPLNGIVLQDLPTQLLSAAVVQEAIHSEAKKANKKSSLGMAARASVMVRHIMYHRMITKMFAFLLFLSLLYIVVVYKILFYLTYSVFGIEVTYSAIASMFLLSRFLFVYFYKDNHILNIPQEEIIWPDISFIIACKNEEESIFKTIVTCMESNYAGKMECIAVDDGSTDDTLAEMHKAKQKYGEFLKIISFDINKGKREAMAEGVLVAQGEIIVCVDSDSFIKRDTLNLLIKHFLIDEKVGAISGNTTVENKNKNLLTKMQSARYGISYDIFKASESVLGTVTCCPGCFSAYRKKALDDILDAWRNQKFLGTKSTFGDDRSLTNFVLRSWKVVYCEKAKASTIVPESYNKFFKQQLRWKKSWIREGTTAARFIWKKNPLAALSFYINMLLPIFGPFVVLNIIFYSIINKQFPIVYFLGSMVMSAIFGAFYYTKSSNKLWWYVTLFSLLYTTVLVWQMPYALFKMRDTKWGTR
jgi:hyaluronan synthase